MRTQILRRTLQRLAATTAIAALGAAAPVGAQTLTASTRQAIQTPPPAQQTAPASQGPVVQLSIEQAVDMALETSLGLKSDRLTVDIASQNIASAKSAFVPTVTAGFSGNTTQRQPTDFTQGSSDISSHNMGGTGSFDQQLPWFGNRYHVGWNASRITQIGGNATFNPQLGSTLSFNITQPLWRNFMIDQPRGNVLSTEINRQISDVNLQSRVVSLEANVRNAYLSYVGAIKGQEVAQQNMDIAQESLRAARARVAVGVGAPIEVIQAQAVAASFEDQLISANSLISTAEDNLRSLILDHDRPDYWQVKLEPTSTILLTERPVDVNEVIKTALANRLDSQVMRQQMQVTDLNLRVNENLTRPSLDFSVSYIATGTGGTQLSYGQGFPPPILSSTGRSFSSALGDAFLGSYPNWTFGLVLGYPIGKSGAEAAVAQNQLQKRQQELALQQLETEIVREVREAVRQVQTAYQRVHASEAAMQATEQQLDAAQRRFEVGLASSFEVQQNQRDLASARQNNLQAKINYNRALISLNAVQKIPQ
ncbi:MAG TPA: TolC family protein [Vicinamibacterales bacterium]|nr:TolC family protein [Vicinamibacterales bacterium]